MGPYYRGTSQATGQFFDLFYQHPILMLLVFTVGISIGLYWWKRADLDKDR